MNDAETEQKPKATVAFISHASVDFAKAQAICHELEHAGIPCWIAPRDVRAGRVYTEEIIDGIEAAHCLILILSQASNKSRAVRDEVERAWSKGKTLYPIRIDDTLPSRSLELLVSSSHWTDARQDAQRPIQKLAAQLASNEDVLANLPPELRRRIRLRRYGRYVALIGIIAVIAAVVALVMSPTQQQPVKQIYTKPPVISFFGSLVGPNFPLKATVLIQSGYDQDGMVDIFKSPVALSLFDVSSGAPHQIYQSALDQFTGAYQQAPTFTVPIPSLPIRIVACLAYNTPKTGKRNDLLVGYAFTLPNSSVGTFSINKTGPEDLRTPASPADCPNLARDYADRNLANRPMLDTSQAARARAIPPTLGCSHANNPAAFACRVSLADANATDIRAGFKPTDLRFVVPLQGQQKDQITFAIPALADTIYFAITYADGSHTSPANITIHDSMHLILGPPPVEIKPATGSGPDVYVSGFPTDPVLRWGLAVAAPWSNASAEWSRDGQSGTPLTKAGSVFLAMLDAHQLGIASPQPPPDDAHDYWVILRDGGGKETTTSYKIDFWGIARAQLRTMRPPSSLLKCTAADNWTRLTLGAVKVTCSARDTGFLLSNIEMGLQPDALQPVNLDASWRRIEAFLSIHDVSEAERRNVQASIEKSYPSASTLSDWHRCDRQTIIGAYCTGPIFVATEPATTVYARLTYWDGQSTPLLKLPVQ